MTSNDRPPHGRLELCVRSRSVRYAGRETKLPDLSFRLLQVLSMQAPEEVRFEEIERAVWGAHVTRETLKQRAKLLRDALSGLGLPEEAISAARSVGYRLTVPTREYDAAAPGNVHGWFRGPRALAAAGGLAAAICVTALMVTGLWRASPDALQIAVVEAPGSADVRAGDAINLSRDLANYLAGVEGIDVLAAEAPDGRTSDLIVDYGLTGSGDDARLFLRLVDAHSGLILSAEDYAYDAQDNERSIAHFANLIHSNVKTLSLRLGRNGQAPQPRAARREYESILGLIRGADSRDLAVAYDRLGVLVKKRPTFALARALRVRVAADLVLRHGQDKQLAERAVIDARTLVEAHPFAADFRYALARALLATGEEAEALVNLNAAARDLPFLERDILVLERQMAEVSAG